MSLALYAYWQSLLLPDSRDSLRQMKLRFYTTDSNLNWKQCKYCGAFCQLVVDKKPTNNTIIHHGDCAVAELENLIKLVENRALPMNESISK